MSSLGTIGAVALGGAIGSLARYGVNAAFALAMSNAIGQTAIGLLIICVCYLLAAR